MKFLHIHKIKITYFLFAIIFSFKLLAIQEYIHVEQHKNVKEQTHQDCQLCHSIFSIGKYHVLAEPQELFTYTLFVKKIDKHNLTVYVCLFFPQPDSSELYNRPPPVFS